MAPTSLSISKNLYHMGAKCAVGAVLIPLILWIGVTFLPWTPIGEGLSRVLGSAAYAFFDHPTACFLGAIFFTVFGLDFSNHPSVIRFLSEGDLYSTRNIRWIAILGKGLGMGCLFFLVFFFLTGANTLLAGERAKEYSAENLMKPMVRDMHALSSSQPSITPEKMADALSKSWTNVGISYRDQKIILVLYRVSMADCRTLEQETAGWTLAEINGTPVSRQADSRLCAYAFRNTLVLQRAIDPSAPTAHNLGKR